jgi:hypothetical protein
MQHRMYPSGRHIEQGHQDKCPQKRAGAVLPDPVPRALPTSRRPRDDIEIERGARVHPASAGAAWWRATKQQSGRWRRGERLDRQNRNGVDVGGWPDGGLALQVLAR